MTHGKDSRDDVFPLHMRAQSSLEQEPRYSNFQSAAFADGVHEFLHELELQQIELDMRNEVLGRARVEFERSRERYRDLYDFAPVGYLALDTGGLIIDVNLSAVQLLGTEKVSLLGRPFLGFVFLNDRDIFSLYHQQVLSSPGTHTCQIRVVSNHGSLFHARLDSSAVQGIEAGQNRFRMVMTCITAHKTLEEEAQETEHRFRTIFQEHDAVMLLIEPETGQILDANHSAQRYYGYEKSQLFEMTIQQINMLPPDDVARDRRKAVLQERNCFHFLHRLASGEVRTVEVHSSPIEFRGRKILFSIIHDITDRKEVEEILRVSEEKFRLIFEVSPDAISLMRERDGTILDVNRGFEKISGYNRDEALFKNPADLNLWARPDDLIGMLEQLETAGRVENCEAEFRRKDGSLFSGLVSAVKVTLDDEPCVVSITKSIEAQKKAEKHLKTQRDLLSAVFETAPFIMMVVNEEGRVQSINRAGATFSGRRQEELLGVLGGEVLGCIHSFDGVGCYRESLCVNCPIRSRVVRTFETGEPVFSEEGMFAVRKGAQEANLHFLISTALLKVDDTDAVLITLEDITDRKSAEEEKSLLQRQLLLAQKMESVGTLAGGIAHDFNNLLQVVLGYSDMLLVGKKTNEPYYEELNAIRQAGRDGSELAKRILAFSQRLEPNARPINLNKEITRLEKMLTRTIPKMIQVRLDLAEDPVTVSADPGQMEQILLNLVVNAQHAMPDGGQLVIGTYRVTLDDDHCRCHPELQPGDYVLLTVSDTGCGMGTDIVERIFEPFFTTKKPGQGTGLGLAMVYGIVKSHKGHITCFSEMGTGTTFRIYLPRMEEEIEQDVARTQQIPAFGTETILLVDDEELIRRVGEKNLKMAGYSVLLAANGQEALQIYRAHRDTIDLVLLDMIMPQMGGKKCLEELLKVNPHVKVVVASGYAVEASSKNAVELGIRGSICKPYEARDLLMAVRKILDDHAQNVDLSVVQSLTSS